LHPGANLPQEGSKFAFGNVTSDSELGLSPEAVISPGEAFLPPAGLPNRRDSNSAPVAVLLLGDANMHPQEANLPPQEANLPAPTSEDGYYERL